MYLIYLIIKEQKKNKGITALIKIVGVLAKKVFILY